MNYIDSDLEEGEILDSPPSPSVSDKKSKELPRRYVVRENKNSTHKHKKDCKYAIHHHGKKVSKLKKSPGRVKNSYKKYHRPSCSREKSHKYFGRYSNSDILEPLLSKNGHSFSQHSLISEMKGIKGVKDLVNRESTKLVKSERLKSGTKDIKTSKKVINNSQTNKKSRNNEFHVQDTLNHSEQLNTCTNKDDDEMSDIIILSSGSQTPVPELIELSPDISAKDTDDIIPSKSPEYKNEESEDEEELRRIALATCAKRKVVSESCVSSIQSADVSVPVTEPETNNVQTSSQEVNSLVSDNYEVVDMEVDDDEGESVGIIQTSLPSHVSESSDNLFVIDTNPSVDFLSNKENSCSDTQMANNSTDEEFEVDLLRAELIDSMYRKKFRDDKQAEQSEIQLPQKPVPVVPEKRVVNYQKQHVNFHRKSLRTNKHVIRRNTVNKSNLKSRTVKVVPPVPLKEPPERLIIALNEESSSEDSEDDPNEGDPAPENPVESIVALISDCRQKSETTEKAKETEEQVPKAVECLSKAQQEEYNSLMKILAEKRKAPASQDVLPQKNGFPLESLKEMEGKLAGLRDALNTKKQSMSSLSKEVLSKKYHYMKAKLSAQHLKEQYIAAEKVRKDKLCVWSKSVNHLKLVKKSVSDLESKINKLQDLCSKIGLSSQGQSNLPLSSSGNKQQ